MYCHQNMKVTIIFSFVLVALWSVFSSPSYAQTTTASTTQNKPTPETPQVTPRPEGTALSKRSQERITNLAANISNRFDAIISRLQNISTRLNSRLGKLEATGTNTNEARVALNSAEASLAKARASINSIDTEVATVIGSQNPKEAWKRVRVTFITIRDTIRLAHTELKNTIRLLKIAETTVTATETN